VERDVILSAELRYDEPPAQDYASPAPCCDLRAALRYDEPPAQDYVSPAQDCAWPAHDLLLARASPPEPQYGACYSVC
jgi:hypothetical protein